MQTTKNQNMAGTKVQTLKVWKCLIFSDLAWFWFFLIWPENVWFFLIWPEHQVFRVFRVFRVFQVLEFEEPLMVNCEVVWGPVTRSWSEHPRQASKRRTKFTKILPHWAWQDVTGQTYVGISGWWSDPQQRRVQKARADVVGMTEQKYLHECSGTAQQTRWPFKPHLRQHSTRFNWHFQPGLWVAHLWFVTRGKGVFTAMHSAIQTRR